MEEIIFEKVHYLGGACSRPRFSAAAEAMTPNGVDEYLSTELPREEPVKAGYLAPEIELIDFTSCRDTGRE